MQHTFFHKLTLTILAGLCAAGLFELYTKIIVGADRSVNGAYDSHYGVGR